MRPILFAAAATIGAVSVLASTDAMAQNGRWCARGTGADNCGFVSYQQCRANIAGIGGKCVPDARAAAAPVGRPEFDRPAPVRVGPVRKKSR